MNSQNLSTNQLINNNQSQDSITQQQKPQKMPTPGEKAQIESLLRSDDERDRNRGRFFIEVERFNPKHF